jgi:hypothetical protein
MVQLSTLFRIVGLAMGVATLMLNLLGDIGLRPAISLLSIGLVCLALAELKMR